MVWRNHVLIFNQRKIPLQTQLIFKAGIEFGFDFCCCFDLTFMVNVNMKKYSQIVARIE